LIEAYKYGDIDMTEAPERAYIDWTHDVDGFAGDVAHYSEYLGPEYIRADLVPKWKPIETAPKDNTEVILFEPIYGVTFGYFDAYGPDRIWCMCDIVHRVARPTHWMPLPEPPKYE